MGFSFKLCDAEHRSLVHDWLKQPYVAEWFYGQGLKNTIKFLDESFEGVTPMQCWLAYDKECPFAFLITSRIDKPDDELSSFCLKDGEAITLDMLIGDTNYLGKGIAHILIQEFLKTQFPQVNEVLIDPEATNLRAIHVYQKVGFKIICEFRPPHSPNLHYMMHLGLG